MTSAARTTFLIGACEWGDLEALERLLELGMCFLVLVMVLVMVLVLVLVSMLVEVKGGGGGGVGAGGGGGVHGDGIGICAVIGSFGVSVSACPSACLSPSVWGSNLETCA